MTEYSVEEVRARFESWVQTTAGWKACKARNKPMHLRKNADGSYNDFRINDRWWAYKAAYAERFEADEGVEPVAQLYLRLDRWDVVGIRGAIEKLHLPAGEYPLFTHPPAQAAQAATSLFTGTIGGVHVGLHGTKESVEALDAFLAAHPARSGGVSDADMEDA